MIRYAITDRHLYPGDERDRREALIDQAARLAADGVDFLQVRERDLPEPGLQDLLSAILAAIGRARSAGLKVLLNGPGHMAVRAQADGVHLRGGAGAVELSGVRNAFAAARLPAPVVSVSCHSVEEAAAAAAASFDLILFGPVFEKRVRGVVVTPGLGLDRLRRAADLARPARLLALGGVTPANSPACLEAGAAGVAGIRLFR